MMNLILQAVAGGIVGALLGSLTEYWVHIAMHRRVILSRTHFNHHREPDGENFLKQFVYYLLGGVPFLLMIGVACWAVALP